MNLRKFYFTFLFLLSFLYSSIQAESKLIFDGSSMEGWSGTKGVWRIEDEAITASIAKGEQLNRNEFIYWKEQAADFELNLEYRIERGNSGIQIRSKKDKHGHAVGYQADLDAGQVWLGRIYDEHGRGLIVERGTLTSINEAGKREVFPFQNPKQMQKYVRKNDWNQYRIVAKGHRVEIHINGIHFSTMEDRQLNQFDAKGLIALQLHSGKGPAKIQFRNIHLEDFPRAEETKDLVVDETKPAHQRLNKSPLLRHLVNNSTQPGDFMNHAFVPKGFQVDTIAREPRLYQPIAMTFDAKGRIWVAEAMAYPRRAKEGEGKDRLLIFSDENHDGSYETQKVFKDDLNLISGFEIGYGGVWVGAAPHLLFIPDANRDDIPDGPAEVILDGWDTRDTHETPNSFLWGHDGWLYGNHGVFNYSKVGRPGSKERTSVQAAVWRLHPITKEFEIYAHGGSNQWGLDYDEVGQMFMTHCRSFWGKGPVTMVIRDGHYWTQNNKNHQAFIATSSGKWRDYDGGQLINFLKSVSAYGHGEGGAGGKGSRSIFGGHSHVGAMVYLGDNWPEEYRGQLYTHNLHGAQMNRELLQSYDSAPLNHSFGRDQLYVGDQKYLAVDMKYGPDGAVYFIDWHDKQHCHTNKFEVWDRSNGRLNRMQWTETYRPSPDIDLYTASEDQLLSYLDHKNEWFARMSQHVIRQRSQEGDLSENFVNQLKKMLFDKTRQNRFRLLVALYGASGISDHDYKSLLFDPDQHIRAQSLTYLTEDFAAKEKEFSSLLLKIAEQDNSARVRLVLAGAAQKRMGSNAKEVIQALAIREEDAEDRFIPKMLWYAYADHAKSNVTEALALASKTKMKMLRDSIVWYSSKFDLSKVMEHLASMESEEKLVQSLKLVEQSLAVNDAKKSVTSPASWKKLSTKLAHMASASEIHKKLKVLFGEEELMVDHNASLLKKGKAAFQVCAACHQPKKNLPGPSLEEIAKVYNNKKELIDWMKKPGKKRAQYPQMPAFDKMDGDSLDAIAHFVLSLRN